MSSRSVIVRDEKGNVIIMDEIHHRTKQGEVFQADVVDSVVNSATISILIRVPSEVSVTLKPSVRGEGNCVLTMYENPTVTGDGTPVAKMNRDRSSAKVSDILTFSTPTISSAGTEITNRIVSPADADEDASEWILKGNEEYLVVATNISGATQDMGVTIEWFQPGATAP